MKPYHEVAEAFHLDMLEKFENIKLDIAGMKPEELADTVSFIKKISELCDDVRKEANKLENALGKIICLIYTQGGCSSPIRGQYSTVTPSLKTAIKFPAKDTEAYADVLDWANSTFPNRFTELYWPAFRRYITEKNEKGESLPEVLAECVPVTEYTTRCRMRK